METFTNATLLTGDANDWTLKRYNGNIYLRFFQRVAIVFDEAAIIKILDAKLNFREYTVLFESKAGVKYGCVTDKDTISFGVQYPGSKLRKVEWSLDDVHCILNSVISQIHPRVTEYVLLFFVFMLPLPLPFLSLQDSAASSQLLIYLSD